ncbi:MAG: type IV secretion system protein [Rubrivivax sp.]
MNCGNFSADGPEGIAQALRAVDCLSRQAAAGSFERLFGSHGALSEVLTAVLALYVALLGLGLLSGRSGLRLSLLTPRALTMGLVLSFATSWVAYQQVVVNLALGAPDELARVLVGGSGSAVDRYAQRLDGLFAAVEEAANAAAPVVDAAGKAAAVSPAAVLGLAAFLLLLGTAGLLIVVKVALAALLALGPVFIVMALFRATRGLFEGWLRATLLFAVAPLIGVLVGGGALALLSPMVQAAAAAGSGVTMRQAGGLLLMACVHLALMAIALRAAAVLGSGWSPGRRGPEAASAFDRGGAALPVPAVDPAVALPRSDAAAQPRGVGGDERIRQLVAAAGRRGFDEAPRHAPVVTMPAGVAAAVPQPAGAQAVPLTGARRRSRGLAPVRPLPSPLPRTHR